MANAVTKAKETAVSANVLDDIFDMAGEGTSYDSSEMQIPFVRVAQSLSPQLNKKKAEYIEGLELGDAYNNVSGEKWAGEEGLMVVPCFQTTKYLEFVPREQGGGFRGEIDPNDPILQRTTRNGGKELLPTGNELVKSDQHFCLVVGEDGMTQPVVVDMKSTQLKVSRRWKTNIAMRKMKHPTTGKVITPPLIATIWKLKTVEESNDKGDFYNWSVEVVGNVEDHNLLMEAKAFRDSVVKGEVKAQAEGPVDGGPIQGHRSEGMDQDDIPF
jgi:hypothetical protein